MFNSKLHKTFDFQTVKSLIFATFYETDIADFYIFHMLYLKTAINIQSSLTTTAIITFFYCKNLSFQTLVTISDGIYVICTIKYAAEWFICIKISWLTSCNVQILQYQGSSHEHAFL